MEELIKHHNNYIANLDNVIKTNQHLKDEINDRIQSHDNKINDIKNELNQLETQLKSLTSIPVLHLTFENTEIDQPCVKNVDNEFISSLQSNKFTIKRDGVYIIDRNLRRNQEIIKDKFTMHLEVGKTYVFKSSICGVFNEGSFIKMNYI